ncbi:putative A disintegrin and metalloproteinase with thrombospondin motifs 7-like [Penaeus vannamei]|uniref:Putative A disintegrin and metalloproteinase with thrombospondin motifs 7-like n=1 Tax=Penaeus vannamei TaxID=6689 RepID=A0A423SAU7_PENVA|nr:putative A disintegrin and metalloproteinase with thrombospondin motifs 7-like [Penaeus vannamei]
MRGHTHTLACSLSRAPAISHSSRSRDWGACLEDEPPQMEYSFPELPPGAMYDADHQCRLSFGAGATHCEGIEGTERICQTLWCHLDNRCITRMEPAAEGTHCGKHKVGRDARPASSERLGGRLTERKSTRAQRFPVMLW